MRRIVPRVDVYAVPVRSAAPQAISIARGLAQAFTRTSLRGAGKVRYGAPALGDRAKFSGYAVPPQLFIGYNPRKVAAGAFRGNPGALPSTSSPLTTLNSPLQRATAMMTDQQLAGR
jgi:hypothetical protein